MAPIQQGFKDKASELDKRLHDEIHAPLRACMQSLDQVAALAVKLSRMGHPHSGGPEDPKADEQRNQTRSKAVEFAGTANKSLDEVHLPVYVTPI
jgi:hypothetical protein